MQGLTNWGKDDIVPDLTPDSDSIQIMAYMQVCEGTAAGPLEIPHTLTYGDTDLTGKFDMTIGSSPISVDTSSIITEATYKALDGHDDKIFKRATKIMELKIPVPEGYVGGLTVKVTNLDYASDVIVDMCGMAAVDAGENLPCLDYVEQAQIVNGLSKLIDE